MTLLKQAAAVYVVIGFLYAIVIIAYESTKTKRRREEPRTAVYIVSLLVVPLAWLPLVAYALWPRKGVQ